MSLKLQCNTYMHIKMKWNDLKLKFLIAMHFLAKFFSYLWIFAPSAFLIATCWDPCLFLLCFIFIFLVWKFGYWNKFYSVDWFLVGWEKRKTESPWFSSFVFFILYVWSWSNKKWSLNLHIFFYDMQVCDVAWIMLIVVLCFREPFCHYSTQLVRV